MYKNIILLLRAVHISNLFQQLRNGILNNSQNVKVYVFSAIIAKCSNLNIF